jgi:anti-sigma factor RsiW
MRRKHVTDRKISSLLDGELSQAEREAISRHIDHCQRCREKAVRWQRIDQYLMHHEREIAPPSFFEQKILSHVHREVTAAADNTVDNTMDNTVAGSVAKGSNMRPYYLFGLNFCVEGAAPSALVFATAVLVAVGIFLGTLMGTKLTAFLASEKDDIDIMAVLSSQDTSSPSITELGLDFVNGNGGESS